MAARNPLQRNRDFRLLFIAAGLSRLGTQISYLALPLLTLRLTGSPARTATLALLEGVLFLGMSLPGGALADHFPRRKAMVVCGLGCAAAMGTLAAAVSLRVASFPLIAATVLVIGVLEGVSQPTSGAALRVIVAEDDLLPAYATVQTRNAALSLVGPMLGGLLFGLSAQLPLWADAVSYLLCTLGVLALRAPLGRPDPAGGETLRSLLRGATDGLAFVWRSAYLRYLALSAAVLNGAFQGVIFLIILSFARYGRTPLSTGVVMSAYGIGALAGAVLAHWVTNRFTARQVLLGVTWSCAVLVPLLAVSHSILGVIAVIAGCALLVPSQNAIAVGTLARLTPDHLQGRVQSATGLLAMSAGPLGPTLVGIALQVCPLWTLFVALGMVIALVALFGHGSAVLRTEPEPEPEPAPEAEPEPAAPQAAGVEAVAQT